MNDSLFSAKGNGFLNFTDTPLGENTNTTSSSALSVMPGFTAVLVILMVFTTVAPFILVCVITHLLKEKCSSKTADSYATVGRPQNYGSEFSSIVLEVPPMSSRTLDFRNDLEYDELSLNPVINDCYIADRPPDYEQPPPYESPKLDRITRKNIDV